METYSSKVSIISIFLWICFPVGREWKPVHQFGNRHPRQHLWICFPVGREWKLIRNILMKGIAHGVFGYAFPLEGNGNKLILWLSFPCSFFFGYAFPLEGNGNSGIPTSANTATRPLWICFPVGRESKHFHELVRVVPFISRLWICFPVGREWKLIRPHDFVSKGRLSLDMLSRWKGMETHGQRTGRPAL